MKEGHIAGMISCSPTTDRQGPGAGSHSEPKFLFKLFAETFVTLFKPRSFGKYADGVMTKSINKKGIFYWIIVVIVLL